MEFSSPAFLFLFLPIFVGVYQVGSNRARLGIGILGSLVFYAWGDALHLPLILALTLGAYCLARGIDKWRGQGASRLLLVVGILAGVGLLITYKLLPSERYPLGLSYVTFQAMAHLIEVHGRGENNVGDLLGFGFYLLIFPKLLVGPIGRYSQIRSQLGDLRSDPLSMADGLRRFMRGLAKKVLIADTLARVVDPIFDLPSPVIAPGFAWLVLVSYALQLYFDFSGYSDMAIGLGRMLGLTFPENFNFPYLSRSIGDFWRRWHISLASWFRDFVFYPLERRRLKWIGQQLNLIVVFLLVGLWHGLSRNFVIWGLLHGAALVFESLPLGRRLTSSRVPLGNLYALSVILVGWVFFRSPTTDFARDFLLRLVGDVRGLRALPFAQTSPLPFIEPTFIMALAAGMLLCFPVGRWLRAAVESRLAGRGVLLVAPRVLYDLGMLFLLLASIAATASSSFAPGIYGGF